eukprot:COSAG01_NODE_4535_length_4945_cov_4.370409_7_plen_117_part_01
MRAWAAATVTSSAACVHGGKGVGPGAPVAHLCRLGWRYTRPAACRADGPGHTRHIRPRPHRGRARRGYESEDLRANRKWHEISADRPIIFWTQENRGYPSPPSVSVAAAGIDPSIDG